MGVTACGLPARAGAEMIASASSLAKAREDLRKVIVIGHVLALLSPKTGA